MDTDQAKEYARLRRIEKARAAESKAAKEQADAMEEAVLDGMLEDGMDSITVDDSTVYLRTDVRANKHPQADPDEFHAALAEVGAGDLVKPNVNGNSLAAWVRELLDAADRPGTPRAEEARATLARLVDAGLMNVHQITKVQVKAAPASRGAARRRASVDA